MEGEGSDKCTRLPDALVSISPWAEVAISPTADAGGTGDCSIGMGASGFVHSPSRTRNARRGTDYLSLRLLEKFALRAGHERDHLLPAEEEEAAEAAALCTKGAEGAEAAALLPPTIIFIGGGELLAEDGRRLSAALSRLCSGRPNHVRLYEEPDAAHDWPLLPWFDVTPGSAARGMDAMVHFIVEMCALHGERPSSQALP